MITDELVQIMKIDSASGKEVELANYGDYAIEQKRLFLNKISKEKFPIDPLLGTTTYNIGMLSSNNAHNVLSNH